MSAGSRFLLGLPRYSHFVSKVPLLYVSVAEMHCVAGGRVLMFAPRPSNLKTVRHRDWSHFVDHAQELDVNGASALQWLHWLLIDLTNILANDDEYNVEVQKLCNGCPAGLNRKLAPSDALFQTMVERVPAVQQLIKEYDLEEVLCCLGERFDGLTMGEMLHLALVDLGSVPRNDATPEIRAVQDFWARRSTCAYGVHAGKKFGSGRRQHAMDERNETLAEVGDAASPYSREMQRVREGNIIPLGHTLTIKVDCPGGGSWPGGKDYVAIVTHEQGFDIKSCGLESQRDGHPAAAMFLRFMRDLNVNDTQRMPASNARDYCYVGHACGLMNLLRHWSNSERNAGLAWAYGTSMTLRDAAGTVVWEVRRQA